MKILQAGLCLLLFSSVLSYGQGRNSSGLQVLYTFDESSGSTVKDRSGQKPAVDLQAHGNTKWLNGSIQLRGKAILKSKTPPSRLITAIKRSNEISVEAWVENPDLKQEGPARLVTLSKNSNERNFTLGQEKNAYDFRLRTSGTSKNGLPSTGAGKGSVTSKLTHIVYTRDKTGRSTFYINGKRSASKQIKGNFGSWDNQLQLAIGDEFSGGRAWNGQIHLVAIFNRSLTERDIASHFRAGPHAKSSIGETPTKSLSSNERLFSDHVAPILSNHCLECHDASTQKGDLDLSTKQAAFANLDAEAIWESIETDEMPHKRPPLSNDEKAKVQQWVKGGASWSVAGRLDPANYIYHGRDSSKTLRRLTVDEYIATVKSTVGVDIETDARSILPADLRADGFSNTAYNLNVDFQHVEAYSRLAALIVDKVDIIAFARQFSSRRNVNDKDMRSLIGSMGSWVLRGDLDRSEVDIYRGITTTVVAAGGGFEEAVSHVLEGMLQSPRFIYQIESGDGSLTSDELASRLSYMIWGSSPDKELRQKARNGELYQTDSCVAQIRRMLKSPLALERSLSFASEWLNLGRLKNMKPNPKHFPNWSPSLAKDMQSETLAYYQDVVWKQQQPMTQLLNTKFTYLTPELAKHYGLKYQGDGQLAKHDVSANPERGGLLTHGSILTIGGDEASMVTRGLFVLNDVLRSIVKDPPPCVDTTPVPTKAGLTQRAIAEERIANKSCGGCHSKFEPLAFGLEKFDGVGAFHHQDHHGNALRDDGEILFPGAAKATPFQNSNQLMDLLASSDRVAETIAWKLTQFSIGRPIRSDDLAAMEQIISRAKKSGGSYHSLIEAIALSDLIQQN